MSIDLIGMAASIANIDQKSGEDLMYSLELTKSSLITVYESMLRKMDEHDLSTVYAAYANAQYLPAVIAYVERCIQALVPQLSIEDPVDFILGEANFNM